MRAARAVGLLCWLARLSLLITESRCANDVLAHWKFEPAHETEDFSANGNDMWWDEETPEQVLAACPEGGGCAYLSGERDTGFKLPNNIKLQGGSGLTVALWWRRNGDQDTWARLVDFNDCDQHRFEANNLRIEVNAGDQDKVKFALGDANSNTISHNDWASDEWIHLVWTLHKDKGWRVWSQKQGHSYERVVNWSGDDNDFAADMTCDRSGVGNRDDGRRPFKGWIDDVRIYNVDVWEDVTMVQSSEGLVYRWRFEPGNFFGEEVDGKDIDMQPTKPHWVTGQDCAVGSGCVYFSQSLYSIPHMELRGAKDGLTIAFWLKKQATQVLNAAVLFFDDCDGDSQLKVRLSDADDDEIRFTLETGWSERVRHQDWSSGEWVEVVWAMHPQRGWRIWTRRAGALLSLAYVRDEADEAAVPEMTCRSNAMGNRMQGERPFQGWLDDVRVVAGWHVDECAEQLHDCAAEAACDNTDGSFTCTCNAGYHGDGVSCTDVDECADVAWSEDGCATNGDGYVHEGAWTDPSTTLAVRCCSMDETDCVSKADGEPLSGSDANGESLADAERICADIGRQLCSRTALLDGLCCSTGGGHDEHRVWTSTRPCHPGATCNNTRGSFACVCPTGFVSNGVLCADLDECALGSCHSDATCNNTAGSFACRCNAGYAGSGVDCADIDECADAASCQRCVNTPGSFNCEECAVGFDRRSSALVIRQMQDNHLQIADLELYTTDSPQVDVAGAAQCFQVPSRGRWYNGGSDASMPQINDGAIATNSHSGSPAAAGDFAICLFPHLMEIARVVISPRQGWYSRSQHFRLELFRAVEDEDAPNMGPYRPVGKVWEADVEHSDAPWRDAATLVDYSGVGCFNIDECEEGTATCDGDATCSDTPGSFECSCNHGFEGNGTACANIDECSIGTDSCDPNAACTDTVGSFTCKCNAGYVDWSSGQTGTACDLDECHLTKDVARACLDPSTGTFTAACSTAQSSTQNGGVSERALDGKSKNGQWNSGGCTHTSNAEEAWWRVDLYDHRPADELMSEPLHVAELKIWNRMDCCTDRLNDFEVWVTTSSAVSVFNDQENRCYSHVGSVQTSESSPLVANCGKAGRYVWIRLPNGGKLTLCEVDVIAGNSSSCHPGAECTNTDGSFTCACSTGVDSTLPPGSNCTTDPTGCGCSSRGEPLACYNKDDSFAQCLQQGACPNPEWGWGDYDCSGTLFDGSTVTSPPPLTKSGCDHRSYQQGESCLPCPEHSTAEPDNYGVFACRCWSGYAMAYDHAEFLRIGASSLQCVPSTYCDGVVDTNTARCFRFFAGKESWHSAQPLCRAWGGDLATVASDSDKYLADRLMDDFNIQRNTAVWIGANDIQDEKRWEWIDGSPFVRNSAHWSGNRPWTNKHYGPYYDCGLIRMYDGRKPMEDYPCGRSNIAAGFLCSMPAQCEPSFFLDEATCAPCPAGATSATGNNFGVYGCECPDAITHGVAPGETAQCLASPTCDGIFDVATLKCWKYFSMPSSWAEAEDSCLVWGREQTGFDGHLSSITSEADRDIANAIFQAYALPVGRQLWVGANDIADEKRWEWTDGSRYTRDARLWLGNRPWTDGQYGPYHDCGTIQRTNTGSGLIDSPCGRKNHFLCSLSPYCYAGAYVGVEDARKSCLPCPDNGTSVSGANMGVEGCQCPPGMALSHVGGKSVGCVEAPYCDGVLDAFTLKCWKLNLYGAQHLDWPAAEAQCEAWGGSLASVTTEAESALAVTMMVAGGLGDRDWAWVGAHDRDDEGRWEWADGSPYTRHGWLWQGNRPWTDGQYAPYHDCAGINTGSGRLLDFPCGSQTQGYLCARAPQCPSGFFVHHDSDGQASCMRCPSNGTSSRGSNFGVYSCRCPAGFAMDYREGQRDEEVQCVASRACDGVQEALSGECWTLHTERESWLDASARCQAWGGELASIITDEDRSLAGRLMVGGGIKEVGSAWVGANDQDDERKWVWVAGQRFVHHDDMWLPGRPHTNMHYGPSMDCAVLRNSGIPKMKDVGCGGNDGLEGSLCTKPFTCPDDTYLRGSSECVACPGNGTSTSGHNFGVFGCTCPAGAALAFNMVMRGTSQAVIECVETSAACDGVLDVQTSRCWKGFEGSMGWSDAEDQCQAWGGHLASVRTKQELMLARIVHDALGFQALHALWVGANDIDDERRWQWTDGFPFSRVGELWQGNRPWTDGQYGPYHDCGRLYEGKLIDARCDRAYEADGFLCTKPAADPAHALLDLDPPDLLDVCRGCWFTAHSTDKVLRRQGDCAAFCASISVPSNALRDIASGTLVPPLYALDLSNNQLAPLKEEWFSGAPTLGLLRVASNGLTELDDPAVFEALPRLQHLDIRDNSVAHLDPEVLQHWLWVSSLQAAGNPLTCHPVTPRPYVADVDFASMGVDFCMVRGCTSQVVDGLRSGMTEEEQHMTLTALQTVLRFLRPEALDDLAANKSLWAPRGTPGKYCWCFPFLRCFDLTPLPKDALASAPARGPAESSPTDGAPSSALNAGPSSTLEPQVVSAPSDPSHPYWNILVIGLPLLACFVLLALGYRYWKAPKAQYRRRERSDRTLGGELAFDLGTIRHPPSSFSHLAEPNNALAPPRRSSRDSGGSQAGLLPSLGANLAHCAEHLVEQPLSGPSARGQGYRNRQQASATA